MGLGGGWCLLAFFFQTTSSPAFVRSRAHFRDRKTLRAPQGTSPVGAALGKNAAFQLDCLKRRQQQCSVACNRTNVEKDTPATWGGLCGAHVFEGFFGLDEPVQSVKMKVETRSRILYKLPHEFALCSLQFRLLSESLLCFIVWNPIRKKTLNPTNVRFRLKARGLLLQYPQPSCRAAAAKTSKRIQKSSFSVGKRIHIRVILCLSLFCLLVRVFLWLQFEKNGLWTS